MKAAALDQLTSQIKTTTGSMKLIEEQLSSRYKGMEVWLQASCFLDNNTAHYLCYYYYQMVKEGQLEARERLIKDMEEKARERAEAAESEGISMVLYL